jgi:hypothetical protein
MANTERLKLADLALRRPRPRGRVVALTTSALVNALILLFGFGAASGQLVSGGVGEDTPEAGAVTVSLERTAGGRAGAADPDPERLSLLYRQALAQEAAIAAGNQRAKPHASLDRLFDEIDEASRAKSEADTDGSGKAADNAGGRADAPDNKPRRGDAGGALGRDGPGETASAGDLWGQIAPCWRKAPNVSRVPVILDLTLTSDGRIAIPPLIVRPDASAPNELRLVAEARALAAVAACVPYGEASLPGAQRRFVVRFAPSG